jgi:hypothetical protein
MLLAIPATRSRVEQNTPEEINRELAREIQENVEYFAQHLEEIEARLAALDREWDIERVLEANAATVSLLGTVLGAFVDRRFFALPALVAGFLLQHAVQGWCPPLPMFRRRGYRTTAEIDRERFSLKALRGDFDQAATTSRDPAARALSAASLDVR